MPPKKKARWTTAQKAAARQQRAKSASRPGKQAGKPTSKRSTQPRASDAATGKPRSATRSAPTTKPRSATRSAPTTKPRSTTSGSRQRPEQQGRPDRPQHRTQDQRPARRPESVRPDPEAERAEADSWTSSARQARSGPVEVAADNGFADLGVPGTLVEHLAREGITTPFAIQAAAIPDALAGHDVLGRGRTGSGKTLAFGLPVLARLTGGRARRRAPRALVLVPTRELAMQVGDALQPLARAVGLRTALVAGGMSYDRQTTALDKGVDVLVATPGRLIDLLDRGSLTLAEIEVAVLDEADHMADMGFLPDVTRILDECAPRGQRLLFSATLDRGVGDLVDTYMSDPVTHSTDEAAASVTTMDHHLMLIDPQHKKRFTAQMAARSGRTLVFARTKLGCERIAAQLREEGVTAAALHGGLNQSVRNRVIGAFRSGGVPVVVATDVAARGIHVDDVSLVLQADPPADHKDYLHRAGRTARAGESGSVVTLVLPHQKRDVTRLAESAGLTARPARTAPTDPVLESLGARTPEGEPVSEGHINALLAPKPSRQRGGGRPRGGRSGGGRPGGGRAGGGRPHGARSGDRSRGNGREKAPRA